MDNRYDAAGLKARIGFLELSWLLSYIVLYPPPRVSSIFFSILLIGFIGLYHHSLANTEYA